MSELERGEIDATFSTLLVVLMSINTAGFTTTHSLRDVVEDEPVPINSRWSLPLEALVSFITGEGFGELEAEWIDPDAERAEIDLEQLAGLHHSMPDGMTLWQAARVEMRPTSLAERRAAQRLRVSPYVVKLWAEKLWGQSLDERASSTASGVSAQARGHATRVLVQQLDDAIPSEIREPADG